MIENIKKELLKLKGKEVEIIIDEGRSRKRKEKGIIKDIYNRNFIVIINNINNSFSFSDLITKTIIIKSL